MVRKKIDNRIRVLIENGIATHHRNLFVIVGDKGIDQVAILYEMLRKTMIKRKPSVMWCYKKELTFKSNVHSKKGEKLLKKMHRNADEATPFEMFVTSADIKYCYYKDSTRILGNTYGICVLQDFEALTPNLLAQTVETVEGGGLIIMLLKTLSSLKQLYTMTMDVHARYRTSSHHDIVGRFNERFILSLASCQNCIVIDDQLNILPISSHILKIEPVPPKPIDASLSAEEEELKRVKENLRDTQPVGTLVDCCKTLDQANVLLNFIDKGIVESSQKASKTTFVLTAARGRGKSAALGLAIAGAIAHDYSNIVVSAPSPENLVTLFEFVCVGLKALEYKENFDYEVVRSAVKDSKKVVVRINVTRPEEGSSSSRRQTIQYVSPHEHQKVGQADLVCIDEAAAIPLPLVKNLIFGPYLVIMSSTVNGYEGTGRSLSFKLIQQLRQTSLPQAVAGHATASSSADNANGARLVHELTLDEAIRYANGDPVERWLYDLLCLGATDRKSEPSKILFSCPPDHACDLYYVNRDTLFSRHQVAEVFLQRLVGLFVSSHYKNSPDDLQMLSDAPAHHIFCLLAPFDIKKHGAEGETQQLPEILCAMQVCLEGDISKEVINASLKKGYRASGDLIPWTVTQQFQDANFGSLSGVRIIRIATHPDYQRKKYGTRALQELQRYYEGKIQSLSEKEDAHPLRPQTVGQNQDADLLRENIGPRKTQSLPPLLLKLSERPAESLDYMGVCYGMTSDLFRFWKKSGFTPVYVSQSSNEITGEHSCIMLKTLTPDSPEENLSDQEFDQGQDQVKPAKDPWLCAYFTDFQRRFIRLLSRDCFRTFPPGFALNVLQQKKFKVKAKLLTNDELTACLTPHDLKRLRSYALDTDDYRFILDLLGPLAEWAFMGRLGVILDVLQSSILLGMGLQKKEVNQLEKELPGNLAVGQILAIFNKLMRKIHKFLDSVQSADIAKDIVEEREISMKPTEQTMEEVLAEGAASSRSEASSKQRSLLEHLDLSEYAIRANEDEWSKALSATGGTSKHLISVKSNLVEKKRKTMEAGIDQGEKQKSNKHSKQQHGKRNKDNKKFKSR